MKNLVIALMVALVGAFSISAAETTKVPVNTQESGVVVKADSIEVLSKDWAEVEKARMDHQRLLASQENEGVSKNTIGLFSVILGVTVPFVAICLILWLIFKFDSRNKKMKYQIVEKAIENGIDLPKDFFSSLDNKNKDKSGFKTPVTLIAVGLALMAFFLYVGSLEVALLVSMIWLIGVGYLIVAILEKKKEKANEDNQVYQQINNEEVNKSNSNDVEQI